MIPVCLDYLLTIKCQNNYLQPTGVGSQVTQIHYLGSDPFCVVCLFCIFPLPVWFLPIAQRDDFAIKATPCCVGLENLRKNNAGTPVQQGPLSSLSHLFVGLAKKLYSTRVK